MAVPIIHPSLLPFVQTGSRTKTLMFGLDPDPRSLEFIRERGILENEAERERELREAKSWLDACYRDAVESGLSRAGKEIDPALIDAVVEAAEALAEAKGESFAVRQELVGALADANFVFKRAISELFVDDELATCTKAGEFVSNAPERMRALGMIDEAARFTELSYRAAYYEDYLKHRHRIFTASRDSGFGTIADRIVEDNIPILRRNLTLAKAALDAYPEAAHVIGLEPTEVLTKFDRSCWFSYFSQSGIDAYNTLLGGWVSEEGVHTVGLNQALSEAFDADSSRMSHRPKLTRLKKMVLTPSDSLSARFKSYNSDEDMVTEVSAVFTAFDSAVDTETGEVMSASEALARALSAARAFGYADIAIGTAASVGYMSELVCGRETALHNADEVCKEGQLGPYSKARKAELSAFGKGRGSGVLRSGVPITLVDEVARLGGVSCDWAGIEREVAVQTTRLAHVRPDVERALAECNSESCLQTNEIALDAMRGMYGALLALRRLSVMFISLTGESPLERYECGGVPLVAFFGDVRHCCDRIRTHLTKKPFSKERWAIDFGNSRLNAGWDAAKTKEYGNMILQHNGRIYYAAIARTDSEGKRIRFDKRLLKDVEGGEWSLLRVKNIPGAAKHLAKLFASGSACEKYGMPEELRDGMREHRYSDDPDFLNRLIEAVSARLTGKGVPAEWVPANWDRLGLKLKPAEQYHTWGEFCADVDASRFAVWGAGIPDAVIQENVSHGRIYLFEIFNRDMRARQKGTKRGKRGDFYSRLLSEAVGENAAAHRIRILGGGQVFFRPASIMNPIVHKKGSWLVNRYYTCNDGIRHRLPDAIRTEIYNNLNGFSSAPLSDEARKYEKLAECHVADYDIVKDARFTHDCFELHVGVEINCGAPGESDLTAAYDTESDLAARFIGTDVPILAVARGERCLAYAVLMSRGGSVLEEQALDKIDGIDWARRLRELYERRAGEQQSWRQKTAIKNLKRTYIQRLASWVANKVVETGAVVAIESPNGVFSDRRSAFEPAVWKGFSIALVDKLSCLVLDATRDDDEPGSASNPLQLGLPWAFYAGKSGVKTGNVLHVSTHWVSDVDLSCGYVPSFSRAFSYTTAANFERSIRAMNSLCRTRNGFTAVLVPSDYSALDCPAAAAAPDGAITLTTCGLASKVDTAGKLLDVESALTKLFAEADIDVSLGRDLREDICGKLSAAQKKELSCILRTWFSVNNGVDGMTASPVLGGETSELVARHKARAVGMKAIFMITRANRSVVGKKKDLDPNSPSVKWHWRIENLKGSDWLSWLAERS